MFSAPRKVTMCGIYCCYGKNNAAQKAFNGLKKLEYRGYDSWGISYASKCAPTLTTVKQVGAISHAKLSFSKNADAAIAHTRWATHGKVTKANAHPQVSADKKFSIVHNGIVENHQDLVTNIFPRNNLFLKRIPKSFLN